MSDMHGENLTLEPEQENPAGQTRVMPPVETSSRPARHRRSDRYLDEAAVEATPAAPAEAEPAFSTEGEPVAPQPFTRVVGTQDATRMQVPRPGALNRAERYQGKSAAQEDGTAVRRPMGTPPGFAPRQPVESAPRDQMRTPTRTASGAARMPVQSTASSARRPVRNGYEQSAASRKKKKGNKLLIALVVLLLVIGLLIAGVMILGQNDSGLLGQARNAVTGLFGGHDDVEPATAATASGFTAAIDRGTAPLDVVFNLTTSKSVSDVRLVDEFGTPLGTSSFRVTENADSIIWMINLTVMDGFEGLVRAEIFDGASWVDTGMSQMLEITMPTPTSTIDVAAFVEVTDAPTDVPTAPPTDVPTLQVTEAPTEMATATPTLAVSATPTIAAAATATLMPAEGAATQAPIVAQETEALPVMSLAADGTEGEPLDVPEGEPLMPEDEVILAEGEPLEAPEAWLDEPTAQPTAQPSATPPLTAEAASSADPKLIKDTVIYNGTSSVDKYTREKTLNMPVADGYITQPYGVMTYRGNAFRQNASVGTVSNISDMSLLWTAEAGSVKGSSSTYYGIGWTGQPAIIKWSKEVRAATNIVADKRETTALKEVIIAGLDGKIYFLDLADGQPTRDAINLGFPMRGTPSLHPLGYPIMAVGQYGRKMASGTGDIGLRLYNLLNQKQEYFIDGLDGKAKRPYYGVGAFDTSALIDPNTDTMVAIGTNGMLYTAALSTEYSLADASVSIKPSLVSMKSRTSKQSSKYVAVQSSPAMYGSYVYYADMEGILRCVDTTTMTTVWAVETDDAVEAAIALDMDEQGNLWLYTANTLDVRKKGDCTIRRYDALSGKEDWKFAVNAVKAKNDKVPGAMASPVIGQYALEDMVYFTFSNVSATGAEKLFGEDADGQVAGVLMALDKASGELVWAYELDAYSYSSPVAVYAEDGTGWIIQASSSGKITMLNGLTGKVVSTLEVEGTIEASPAVYNDILVIGTTGKNTAYIYGIKLQ